MLVVGVVCWTKLPGTVSIAPPVRAWAPVVINHDRGASSILRTAVRG